MGGRQTSSAKREDEDEGEDVEGGVVVAMMPLGSAGRLLGRFLSSLKLGEQKGGRNIRPMCRCCRMHEQLTSTSVKVLHRVKSCGARVS